jgi:alpha-tubulin suppressor-like RCC1 family protein
MKVVSAAALSFDTVALCEDGRIYSTGRFQFARADDERTFTEIPVNRGVPRHGDQENAAIRQQGGPSGRDGVLREGVPRASSSGAPGADDPLVDDPLVELFPGYSTVYAVTKARDLFCSFFDQDPDELSRDHGGLLERANVTMERVLLPESYRLAGMATGRASAYGQGLHQLSNKIRVRSLSASNYHTALVSECGLLLTWGHGQKGQLGHGDRHDRPSPTVVQWAVQQGLAPVQVSCGADYEGSCRMFFRMLFGCNGSFIYLFISPSLDADGGHSAVLSNQGVLYTFGGGESGELGHGSDDLEDKLLPTEVSSLVRCSLFVRQVVCGENYMYCAAVPLGPLTGGGERN